MLRALFVGLIVLSTSQAFAAKRHLACANGTIDTAGDSLFEMNIFADKIEFLPYEGSIVVSRQDVTPLDKVLYIKNLKTTYTVEGDKETVELDARLAVTPGSKAAVVSLRYNDGTWAHYKLLCKIKSR